MNETYLSMDTLDRNSDSFGVFLPSDKAILDDYNIPIKHSRSGLFIEPIDSENPNIDRLRNDLSTPNGRVDMSVKYDRFFVRNPWETKVLKLAVKYGITIPKECPTTIR